MMMMPMALQIQKGSFKVKHRRNLAIQQKKKLHSETPKKPKGNSTSQKLKDLTNFQVRTMTT